MIQGLREEYQKCNEELRTIVEAKTNEIIQLQNELKSCDEKGRKQRQELEETLQKDRYTTDIYAMENEKLREAKTDFEQEREQFYNAVSELEKENQGFEEENKDLKRKIKKLEHILYGKK